MSGLATWFELARETLVNPRLGARRILDMNLPQRSLWELLVLTAVLTDLVLVAGLAIDPATAWVLRDASLPGPLVLALLQFAALALMAGAIHTVGRIFGGKGVWPGALALVAWIQLILFGLQLVQIVLFVLIPPLGDLMGLVSMAVLIWLLIPFVAELHGFKRLGLVFLVVVLSFLTFGLVLSYLLAMMGLMLPGAA